MALLRIQKYMSDCGVMSRRKSEEAIREGLVRINGEIAQIGSVIDDEKDVVEYNGQPVTGGADKLYLMLNKPKGYVTTSSDELGRPTVLELVKDAGRRVYPVGRLDINTTGLLLLTDDGSLAHKLTHPGSRVQKVYLAKVEGYPSKEQTEQLRRGVDIGGYVTQPAKVSVVSTNGRFTVLRIAITEGKNRQVRKMTEAVGCRCVELERVELGGLSLDVPLGKYRRLTAAEVSRLI